MKYFSIERIKRASRHLEHFHSSWVIPAFVLAANGVNQSTPTVLMSRIGTDKFLDRYFNGSLIGLPQFASGNNALRPRFHDLMGTFRKLGIENDYAIRQDTKLWANLSSSRGHRDMLKAGELKRTGQALSLTKSFQTALEKNIPDAFRFEELMVWLYAFRGFPEEVTSWKELKDHLLASELSQLTEFPAEFRTRFKLYDDYAWPDDITNQRASNQEYQTQLMPGYLRLSEATIEDLLDTPVPVSADSYLPDSDPVMAEVIEAAEDRQARNFLFLGPPATGKTWYARQIAKQLTGGDQQRYLLLQFHPSFSYDDFVEGYSPKVSPSGSVTYEASAKHFLKICDAAQKRRDAKFVVVIDELSRGDASRIFGEMLTYIEPQYRNEPFSLAYSENEARVPDNLLIITTANPYDRSVAELDDAFLRRFYMIEFPANGDRLKQKMAEEEIDDTLQRRLLHLFDVINAALPHGFGHAHFFGLTSTEDVLVKWRSGLKFIVERALVLEPDKMKEINETFSNLFPQGQDPDSAEPSKT